MTGIIPSVQAPEFETSLINELERLGAFVIPQFRVPGTHTYVDFYIASPARAFVEIKLRESPILSDLRRMLYQLEHLRREFGGEIVPIVIVGGEPWHSSPLTQEFRDLGVFILSLDNSAPDVSSSTYCAKEIQKFLMHLPYRFKGIEFFATKASPSRENLPSKLMSAPDIFLDVLVSLKSVLGAEQFVILEQELSAFSEEYRHEHYTACALRIGRTLEHVVYALARDWGVNVNRATLQVLSDLDNSFDQLSGAVIAYATTDENERTRRMKLVQDRLVEIQKKLIRLNFDIHSDLHPKSTDVPVNVESILRDIRKQFGRNNKVLDAINNIIDKNIVRKILDARNNAAHASTNGVRRELSKNDIDNAVELLRTALFLFGNVAFAVAEKDE
jgi:hypothetical protein